jgi:hypothetical protein
MTCEIEHRRYPTLLAGLVPLRATLGAGETLRASFTAVWSEPHYVALVFPANVDREIGATVERLASAVGRLDQSAPKVEFGWRILLAGREVGRGTGEAVPTAAFYRSGETSLAFGQFPADAGHTYELEVRQGPGFEPFVRAVPMIEIGVNSPGPSLGLAWANEFDRPLAGLLAILGLALFASAVWTTRRSSTPERTEPG